MPDEWSSEALVGKATLYYGRAAEHSAVDDEFALWLLLGTEFLLRGALATVSPALLAEADSLVHALGFTAAVKNPRNVGTSVVIARLQQVYEEFGPSQADDAQFLTGLRNAELHSGKMALSINNDQWLPKLLRVVETLCAVTNHELTDLLHPDIVAQAQALTDTEDKKLKAEIEKRRAAARAFYDGLTPSEIQARVLAAASGRFVHGNVEEQCPACGELGWLSTEYVRSTGQRYEDGVLISTNVSSATGYTCPVCGFALASLSEVAAAGLPQERTSEAVEDPTEQYYEPEYMDE